MSIVFSKEQRAVHADSELVVTSTALRFSIFSPIQEVEE